MFMRMIYDDRLAQAAYLIGCQKTGQAIVIDPERDVDRYLDLAEDNGLQIVAAAETHIHADFLSGARELAELVGAKVYLSDEGDADWKYQWLNKKTGGGSYDHQLLKDGDSFRIGNIELKAVHCPGHTPEHMSYLVTDHGAGATEPIGLISGDFLFVGDLGRPDLLETAAGHHGVMDPSARMLFRSLHTLDPIPEFVQVWPAHGAGSPCGKALGAIPTSTIGYEKRFNPAIAAATNEQAFVDYILSGQPEPPLYFANMKRDNKLGPSVLGGVPLPPRITLGQLRNLDPRKIAIMDTRPWDDFRTGHIPGSLSFPLTRSFSIDAGSLIHEDEDIYLIISADEVEQAVRALIRIGLDNIKGWFDAEQIAHYPGQNWRLETIDERTPDEVEQLLSDESNHVLDVRRATEFAEGHIPGATNVSHTRLAARMDEVPKGKRLIVGCRSGARSARSCAFLKRLGHDVINLKGGYVAWQASQADKQTTSS